MAPYSMKVSAMLQLHNSADTFFTNKTAMHRKKSALWQRLWKHNKIIIITQSTSKKWKNNN